MNDSLKQTVFAALRLKGLECKRERETEGWRGRKEEREITEIILLRFFFFQKSETFWTKFMT